MAEYRAISFILDYLLDELYKTFHFSFSYYFIVMFPLLKWFKYEKAKHTKLQVLLKNTHYSLCNKPSIRLLTSLGTTL